MGTAAKSFEELVMYQKARELVNGIYTATRSGAFAKDFGLTDQMRRAGVSILSNIAEGFERGSKTEFIHFLYIAKGSCGEIRAQLQIAQDQHYIPAPDCQRMAETAKWIGSMISKFIAHLQTTSYKGRKFNSSKKREA
jgi:four helix bundle protein